MGTVRAGAHNLKNSANEEGTQNIGVKLVVKHKDFTMQTLHSDIAILVLKSPIQYTSTVRRVCLPSSSTDTYEGKMGTVAGWGLLREGGSRPTVLMELSIKQKVANFWKYQFADLRVTSDFWLH